MADRRDSDRLIDTDYTMTSLNDLPADELIRRTREFIRRVTNEDRQRLARDLRLSGHHATLRTAAPPTLLRFFTGETDLDEELAQRYVHAPLLSHVRFAPAPGEPVIRRTTAYFSSQDDSALMTVGAPVGGKNGAAVEFSFTLMSMMGLSFHIDPLADEERRGWLDLLRRENGITFLWTQARWERPYVIFVVRDLFARIYAFAPAGFEAGARMTPDMVAALADWLEAVWFPPRRVDEPPGGASERPTLIERPGTRRAGSNGDEPPPGDPFAGDLSPGDLVW